MPPFLDLGPGPQKSQDRAWLVVAGSYANLLCEKNIADGVAGVDLV